MFVVDPTDLNEMIALMDRHDEFDESLLGINENKEVIVIGVFKDRLAVRTLQVNGWVRLNVYYRDGSVEEMFEERWCDEYVA